MSLLLFLVLLLVALLLVAIGAILGCAWRWHRDRPWVRYGRVQWQHNNPSAAMNDIHAIRHDAQAAMFRTAAAWRRSR